MANPKDAETLHYFGRDIPFLRHIGLRAESLGTDYCKTSLALEPTLVNSRGDIHGGTIMTALDFTLSAAARAHDIQKIGAATIEMSTHFLLPARTDLIIDARCLRRGKSIAFCEGQVIDTGGKVVAVARGTFKLLAT